MKELHVRQESDLDPSGNSVDKTQWLENADDGGRAHLVWV